MTGIYLHQYAVAVKYILALIFPGQGAAVVTHTETVNPAGAVRGGTVTPPVMNKGIIPVRAPMDGNNICGCLQIQSNFVIMPPTFAQRPLFQQQGIIIDVKGNG